MHRLVLRGEKFHLLVLFCSMYSCLKFSAKRLLLPKKYNSLAVFGLFSEK